MLKYLTTFSFMLLSISLAQVAPFGIQRQATAVDLKNMNGIEIDKGLWRIYSPPSPNSFFTSYYVTISPKRGICKVVAATSSINNDSYGQSTKQLFWKILEVVVGRYGEYDEAMNAIYENSLWKPEQYWMMGLFKNERFLYAHWYSKKNQLPEGLRAVALTADGVTMDSAFINLAYEFEDFEKCLADSKGDPGEGL